MKTLKKILLTLLIVMGFVFLHGIIFSARSASGYTTPGPFATLITIAMIVMIYTIWKKPKNNDNNQSGGKSA